MQSILEVKNLSVSYTGIEKVPALRAVSFSLRRGEILGIVGESGSGKSTLALSVLNLLPQSCKKEGEVLFRNKNIMALSERQWEDLRGRKISMVFQEPAAMFNPVLSIGYQFQEIIDKRGGIKSRTDRIKIIANLFQKVRLSEYQRVMNSYPHQLSGGQLQRVSIAMAVWQNPDVLVADEPTSSLDVTIESQIISLFKELRDAYNLAVIFITHNLDLVKALCDRAVVFYQGKVREIINSEELFSSPKDIYTVSLVNAFKELGE